MADRVRPKLYYPSLVRVRQVVVYQPAVPLRAVMVLVDNGEVFRHEETVLGVQVIVADRYRGRGTPVGTDANEPRTFSHADISQADYWPERSMSAVTEHRLVIWSSEFNCPVVLDEDPVASSSGGNFAVVAGPVTEPAERWEARLRAAEREVRERYAGRVLPAIVDDAEGPRGTPA